MSSKRRGFRWGLGVRKSIAWSSEFESTLRVEHAGMAGPGERDEGGVNKGVRGKQTINGRGERVDCECGLAMNRRREDEVGRRKRLAVAMEMEISTAWNGKSARPESSGFEVSKLEDCKASLAGLETRHLSDIKVLADEGIEKRTIDSDISVSNIQAYIHVCCIRRISETKSTV